MVTHSKRFSLFPAKHMEQQIGQRIRESKPKNGGRCVAIVLKTSSHKPCITCVKVKARTRQCSMDRLSHSAKSV